MQTRQLYEDVNCRVEDNRIYKDFDVEISLQNQEHSSYYIMNGLNTNIDEIDVKNKDAMINEKLKYVNDYLINIYSNEDCDGGLNPDSVFLLPATPNAVLNILMSPFQWAMIEYTFQYY